jgi:hypothetical protein
MVISPRHSSSKHPNISKTSFVTGLTCILKASPWDSILLAVLTVSPNKQYLGILRPTTPATQGPTQYIKRFMTDSMHRGPRCVYLCAFLCGAAVVPWVCGVLRTCARCRAGPGTSWLSPWRVCSRFSSASQIRPCKRPLSSRPNRIKRAKSLMLLRN